MYVWEGEWQGVVVVVGGVGRGWSGASGQQVNDMVKYLLFVKISSLVNKKGILLLLLLPSNMPLSLLKIFASVKNTHVTAITLGANCHGDFVVFFTII